MKQMHPTNSARHIFAAAVLLAMLAVFSFNALAANPRWESTTSRDANNNICIDFQDVQVILPSDWAGKCQMNISTDYVTFCHIRSRELWTEELGYSNGGTLFSIVYTEDNSFMQTEPSYSILGTAGNGTYYMTFPTDLQAYTNDESVYQEFLDLSADVDWVQSHISVSGSQAVQVFGTSDEYIFPQSSSSYLSESDLSGMSADEVQMAINEIYARHHRKFVLENVQAYFNSKSWYTGTVEAEDFDVSVMNTYESANINLMVARLSQLNSGTAAASSSASTADAYGMIIETGDSSFRIRISDGSSIQFWYDVNKLDDMGLTVDSFEIGAVTSLIYDTDSYEALDILIW